MTLSTLVLERVGGPLALQLVSPELLIDAIIRIIGFVLLAAGATAGFAFVFRWYSTEELPEGVAVLVGLTTVALWLNTKTALQEAIIGDAPVLDPGTAVYTVITFVVSGIAADAGRRLGDYLARDLFAIATPQSIDDVGQLVRAAGRVTTVELPTELADADGYDPVDEETKAVLAEKTLLFPRRLTIGELEDRLATRLEGDYGIGYVDVQLTIDGSVERLAVGSTPAGIGPTLAPETVAVAIEADPAPDGSPGDSVDIWAIETDGARRITTGELRGTAGDVATLVVDAEDASTLDTEREYRLVTLPGAVDAGRELRSLLRSASETITKITVGTNETDTETKDGLVGESVDSLPAIVLGLERADDASAVEGEANSVSQHRSILAFPEPTVQLEAGDTCYVLGRPDALRRLRER